MPIFELSSDNFQVVGRGKKNLSINVPGAVLVFFKMDTCEGCKVFRPIFERLSAVDSRISYAVLNISTNRIVARKSQETNTPIHEVPFIMMYIDGRPKAIYRGKRNISSIQSFIGKILSSTKTSSSFMPSGGRGYPQPGHSGYSGGATPPGRVWMPEGMKKPSSLSGVTGGSSPYAQLGDLDDEDDQKLLTPEEITPHNLPWESGRYSSLGE